MTQEQSQVQSQPINTVEQMGELVVDWLQNKHAQLSHLRDIPDTEKLEVEDEDTKEVLVLEGQLRTAFMMGIAVAQKVFAEPPFKVVDVPEEDEDTNEPTEA